MRVFKTILISIAVVFLAYILLLSVSALAVGRKREYQKNSKYYRMLLNSGVFLALILCRVGVSCVGKEKLPDGRFLLVSNHRSNFDPIVTWYSLKERDLSFISKPENFSIPWFGRIIRKCCCLPIDRKDPSRALITIRKASELIKKDQVSVGVYPEGTRSKTGELLPFHSVMLKIAQQANVPIVVAAITGTEQIHKNYPWKRSRVEINIADVISAEEVKCTRAAELGQKIVNILEKNLKG